jgi:hypothetical protein
MLTIHGEMSARLFSQRESIQQTGAGGDDFSFTSREKNQQEILNILLLVTVN